MQVLYGEMAYFDPEYFKIAAIAKVTPKPLLAWLQSRAGQWFGKELNEDGVPDATIFNRYEQNWLRRERQVVAYLASKDANFVFGTDTPSSPTYANLPGLNGYLEMKQLERAGMSLAQIFRAATTNNAREFKMEGQLGSIEPGKIANLTPEEIAAGKRRSL
jgi:imidazolonepropionase-like amidohydrolase